MFTDTRRDTGGWVLHLILKLLVFPYVLLCVQLAMVFCKSFKRIFDSDSQ